MMVETFEHALKYQILHCMSEQWYYIDSAKVIKQ